MRYAFITSEDGQIPKDDLDHRYYVAEAQRRGDTIDSIGWGFDPATTGDYDLAVFRSCWDYPDAEARFVSWIEGLDPRLAIANPPTLIRWNMDKRYLADLAAAGVAVVQTRFCDDRDAAKDAIAELAAANEVPEVVIKPTVSAGSRLTGRFRRDDPQALALVEAILRADKTVMVQPAALDVARNGELDHVVLGGELSHVVRKGPILDGSGGMLGGEYREEITPAEPLAGSGELAEATMAAVRSIANDRGWSAALPYGRIDVVMIDGEPRVLEAELFEPSLFLWTDEGAAARLFDALEACAAMIE